MGYFVKGRNELLLRTVTWKKLADSMRVESQKPDAKASILYESVSAYYEDRPNSSMEDRSQSSDCLLV